MVCDRIHERAKDSSCELFVVVRKMFFNRYGELKPKMYKGRFDYSVSCTLNNTVSYNDIAELFWRRERNVIDSEDLTVKSLYYEKQ